MSQIVYLLDACTPHSLADALRGMEPSIEIHLIGVAGLPPRSTKDPDILAFAETRGMLLVTFDKRTMPRHIADHLASGRHTAGVLMITSRDLPQQKVAEDLLLVWTCDTAEDWIDKSDYLPL